MCVCVCVEREGEREREKELPLMFHANCHWQGTIPGDCQREREREVQVLTHPLMTNLNNDCLIGLCSVEQYKDRLCMGYRQELNKEVVKKTAPDGSEKEWIVLKMKPTYDFFNYDVIGRRIQKIGKGLRRVCHCFYSQSRLLRDSVTFWRRWLFLATLANVLLLLFRVFCTHVSL
jgi:hypothetical protein